MKLDLPYPAKVLWPNGRTLSKRYLNVEFQKHKGWAYMLASAAFTTNADPVPINIIVHGKSRGPLPDRDGVSAAAKAYLDGISERIGINDRRFDAPTVEFAQTRTSRFVIEIGHG
jgi:hypothetical protein